MTGESEHMSIMKRVAVPLVGAALVLSFTGCSNGIDGEYVQEDGTDLKTITVKGNNITYAEIQCDGSEYEIHSDTGTFNNNQTIIVWTEQGYWDAAEPAVVTENSIMIDDETFYKRNSDQGKREIAEVQESCNN